MLSFRSVSLLFFVLRIILSVPDRKVSVLTQNANLCNNLTFCNLSEGVVVDDDMFAVFGHLFEACVTFLVVRLFFPLQTGLLEFHKAV
jgi:hypothetical protein